MSDHGSRSAAGREPLDAESANAANAYAAKKRADAHQLADVAVTSSLRRWSSPLKSGAVDRAQELVAVHLLAALDRLLNDVPLRPRHPVPAHSDRKRPARPTTAVRPTSPGPVIPAPGHALVAR